MPYALALAVLLASATLSPGDDEPDDEGLTMSRAILCEKVEGFGDYVERDDPELTRDEKLIIYYEPSGYQVKKEGEEYLVHLIQDCRIRRKGQKKVLMAKDKILDYKGKFKQYPVGVYLANTISIKELPPGEYDLEIVLRDDHSKAKPTRQVFSFQIRRSGEKTETKGKAEKEEKPKS